MKHIENRYSIYYRMLIGKTEKYVLDKNAAVYKYKSQKSCPYYVTILFYKLLLRDYSH